MKTLVILMAAYLLGGVVIGLSSLPSGVFLVWTALYTILALYVALTDEEGGSPWRM